METVLVTGAAGFIGSHTVDRLLELGHKVIGIDAFTDYYSPSRKEANLNQALGNENFTLIKDDICTMNLENVLGGVDRVAHFAAQAGVRGGWENDFEVYRRNNILATQKLLQACKGKNIKKFLFASSSSIYGNAPYPTPEDTPPNPLSPYGKTKVEAEKLCNSGWDFPIIILRYFTVFGPRQRPDMAIYKFIKALFEGKEIEIYGDGEQKRDFTYITDVVAANIKALLSEETGIFNIAGKNIVVVNRLVEDLVKLSGILANIRYLPAQKGDVSHTGADISKAVQKLGFNPEVKLFKGLEKQIAWYCKDILNREPPEVKYWKPY